MAAAIQVAFNNALLDQVWVLLPQAFLEVLTYV